MTSPKKPRDSKKKSLKATVEEIKENVENARKKNEEAEEKAPQDISIKLLEQDTGNLKWGFYFLAGALLISVSAGWAGYLHLDNKVEHKMDYMNLRIDNIISYEEIKRKSK